MSHEKGIEAASREFNRCWHAKRIIQYDDTQCASNIIKAYLEASGMVLVPREPTEEMEKAYDEADRFYRPYDEICASAAWQAMIKAAPNPLQSK